MNYDAPMNCDTIYDALRLPAASIVNQRVPKKLLIENGASTAADKRLINDGVEELQWLAALKPTTIGVPAYRDEVREYLEIAVLRLTLRAAGKAARLVEMVHRAVPYPLLLLTEQADQELRPRLSAAHKRWSLADSGKTVLEGDVLTVDLVAVQADGLSSAFLTSLAVDKQPRATLYAIYQGWIDSLLALQAARLTGTYALATTPEQAGRRRDALEECARLDAEIARLRVAAARERQMSRRVDLNLELKRVEAARAAAHANL